VVERDVVILLELVEESARGGFRLSKIDRSVVIGIEARERRSCEGRRSAHQRHCRKRDASKEARVKVFSVVSFIVMLLEKIGDEGVQRSAARSSQRGLAMICDGDNWSGTNTQESLESIPLIPGKIPDVSWPIIPQHWRAPKCVQATEAPGCSARAIVRLQSKGMR
jgi:hypothetical protein